MSDFFKIQNILSLMRLPILFFVIYFIKENKVNIVLFLLSLAVITDILDGYIARKKKEDTELGKILDHVIDKIFFNSVSISLYFFKGLPLFFVIILFLRDFVSLFFGYLLWKKGKVIGSNIIGKLSGFFLSLVFIFYLLNFPLKEYLVFLSLFFILLASASYFIIFLILWREIYKVKKAG